MGATQKRNSRAVFLFFVTFVAVLTLTLTLTRPTGTDVRLMQDHPLHAAAMLNSAVADLGKPMDGGDATVALSYNMNYITEDIALELPVCEDYKMAGDLQKSKLSLKNPVQATVSLGDTIAVSIQLIDGYGNNISMGGADVRPRMYNEGRQAYATAAVTDHGNGTYTALFEALWEGRSTIKVKIAYTPESIRAIYYIRKKFRGTRDINGVFSAKGITRTTLCHPTKRALLDANYSRVCNLTWDNSGMPWFCGKPDSPHLLCEDWTSAIKTSPVLPLTKCELSLLNRSAKDMEDFINVTVKQRKNMKMQVPTTSCRSFNRTALWNLRQPTGYMYENKWHLNHCKGYDKRQLFTCLQNKTVLLFGDSTVRQWYEYIEKHWSCSPITGHYTTGKPHREIRCDSRKHNFTVRWLPHSQPFLSTTIRYTKKSISRHLDEVGTEERVIALIHIYLHTLPYHYSVFREKIRRIRSSVQNLLSRNRFVKVLIKGFHTYYNNLRLSDYFGKVYKDIVFEEFTGLRDRVIYLEQKDITDARAEKSVHPSPIVIESMVDQMMSYVC